MYKCCYYCIAGIWLSLYDNFFLFIFGIFVDDFVAFAVIESNETMVFIQLLYLICTAFTQLNRPIAHDVWNQIRREKNYSRFSVYTLFLTFHFCHSQSISTKALFAKIDKICGKRLVKLFGYSTMWVLIDLTDIFSCIQWFCSENQHNWCQCGIFMQIIFLNVCV